MLPQEHPGCMIAQHHYGRGILQDMRRDSTFFHCPPALFEDHVEGTHAAQVAPAAKYVGKVATE